MRVLSIVFSLLLTAAIYMAFPISFAVLSKKPIRLGIYRLICWIVAIVLALAVQIVSVMYYPEYKMTFVPAFIWTCVGIAIGKKSIHMPDNGAHETPDAKTPSAPAAAPQGSAADVIALLQVLLSCHEESLYHSEESAQTLTNEERIAFTAFYYHLLFNLGRTSIKPIELYDQYTDVLSYGYAKAEALSLFSFYDKSYEETVVPGSTTTYKVFVVRLGYRIYEGKPPLHYVESNHSAIMDTIDYINGKSDYDPGILNTPMIWPNGLTSNKNRKKSESIEINSTAGKNKKQSI